MSKQRMLDDLRKGEVFLIEGRIENCFYEKGHWKQTTGAMEEASPDEECDFNAKNQQTGGFVYLSLRLRVKSIGMPVVGKKFR